MNPGDLVRFDSPDQRAHGKAGIIVGKTITSDKPTWYNAPMRFSYDVLVDGEIWRCAYEDLIEEEAWEDETR